MRLLIIFILIGGTRFANSQHVANYFIEYVYNDISNNGPKLFIETGISGGIKYNEHFSYGVGIAYNFTRTIQYKKVNDQGNLKYFNLYADVSYLFIKNSVIRPVLKMNIGTGLPSHRNDSISLDYQGSPSVLDKGIQNWENFHHGFFVRNSLRSSLSLIAEFNLVKNVVFEIGGGYQYRLVRKTPTWYYPDRFIHQHNLMLNVGVKHVFRCK